jgi:uncharacterized protein (TIGR02596 family)
MSTNRHAFSLVELLIVVAIIGILAVLTIPAFVTISDAKQITAANQSLSDGLRLARQLALVNSTPVEFRLWNIMPKDGLTRSYCAYSYNLITDSGVTNFGKTIYFAKGVSLSTASANAYSTLVTVGLVTISSTNSYASFNFRPDGSTDLNPTSKWFATFVRDREVTNSSLPNNYITLRIDPLNGNVSYYRP